MQLSESVESAIADTCTWIINIAYNRIEYAAHVSYSTT